MYSNNLILFFLACRLYIRDIRFVKINDLPLYCLKTSLVFTGVSLSITQNDLRIGHFRELTYTTLVLQAK